MSTQPVVFLTGAGSGIGLITATQLICEHNAKVQVLTLIETPELSKLVEENPNQIRCTFGDATDDSVVGKALLECVSNFGVMTHLISCIGTMLPVQTIRNVALKDFRRGYDINVFALVSLVQQALPLLDKSPIRPTIVVVTSGVDHEVLYQGWSSYCSSKAALTRFIHVLAHEEKGIDVYGILPAVTKSPMVQMILDGKYDEVMLPEERERFNIWNKNGNIEPPEPIVKALLKAAMGQIRKDSPEVRRQDPVIMVQSLYEKSTTAKITRCEACQR